MVAESATGYYSRQMKNKELDRLLFWDRVCGIFDSVPTAIFTLLFVAVVLIFYVNASGPSTIESGIVIRAMSTPDKYQAFDTVVFVEMADKRVVPVNLANGIPPPPPGEMIKVRRVKRILFGEHFMLAGAETQQQGKP
jgi:hypothetical protein